MNIKNPEQLWSMQKAKLKLIFPHLVDSDFQYDYGKKDVMLELLQAKLGKSREDINLLLFGL
ncbi:general stress protein CsbD [Pseudochryseolinea flava]|uniref:General stress protein CsbD n=1 Tax=Pseudochryseolinea flava TaxID=2059302 RepID=A0A364Y6Y1_9BACT|nr:general stress protein CsbD [Pseudochryseolinea flava]RAW02021.1 general stress protein CsbD [Pseudochryseolinea flava]